MTADTNTETSTDLVTLEQVEDALLHGGNFEPVSAEQVQQDMIRQILSSETLEEAFQTFEATPLDAILGAPVEIGGIAWLQSAFKEGPSVYALLAVKLLADHVGTGKKGDELKVSMGGGTTMASFVWAQRNTKMPFKGTFDRQRSNANPERSFIVFKLA